jgi:hypothetical protein
MTECTISEFNSVRLEYDLVPEVEYKLHAAYTENATHNASDTTVLTFTSPAEDEENLPPIAVDTLVVNGDTLTVDHGESEYSADCYESEIVINIGVSLPQISINISVSGVSYNEQPIPLALPGTTINVDIDLSYGQRQGTHRLRVNKSIDDSRLLFRRWDDVLSVNRNPSTNGGHNIKDVRFQNKNTPSIFNDNPYVNTSAPASDFNITVNIENSWHNVCGEPATRSLDKVKVYPNPVSIGDNLTLVLPKGYAGGSMKVLTIDGATVKSKLPLPDDVSIVNVSDWAPGVYLLNVTGKNGKSETVKVIVNN